MKGTPANQQINELILIIKDLTDNQGFANVEIIIKAGSIELVTVSKKYKMPSQQREVPGDGSLVK